MVKQENGKLTMRGFRPIAMRRQAHEVVDAQTSGGTANGVANSGLRDGLRRGCGV